MSESPLLDLASPAATRRLAQILAGTLRVGDVIALWGDLGLGKTYFARALIETLAGTSDFVPSPTFTLVQTYPVRIAAGEAEIWHFDLYRLERPQEALELGIEDAFIEGISLIEWPERLGSLLPARRLDIRLEPGGDERSRRVRLSAGRGWEERLAGILSAWRA